MCRTGCPTQDHESYGACLRDGVPSVIGLESTSPSFTRERERQFNKENEAYRAAKAEGLQPAGIDTPSVDLAKRLADEGF